MKRLVSKNGIDLLHIDANERYLDVKRDWDNYTPLVNPGGIILLHDIHYTNDIRKFWNQVKVYGEYEEIWQNGQGMGILIKG